MPEISLPHPLQELNLGPWAISILISDPVGDALGRCRVSAVKDERGTTVTVHRMAGDQATWCVSQHDGMTVGVHARNPGGGDMNRLRCGEQPQAQDLARLRRDLAVAHHVVAHRFERLSRDEVAPTAGERDLDPACAGHEGEGSVVIAQIGPAISGPGEDLNEVTAADLDAIGRLARQDADAGVVRRAHLHDVGEGTSGLDLPEKAEVPHHVEGVASHVDREPAPCPPRGLLRHGHVPALIHEGCEGQSGDPAADDQHAWGHAGNLCAVIAILQ